MRTLAAAFLCLAVLLPSPAPGQAIQRAHECCLTTTNSKIRVSLVDRYRIQKKGLCPVDAVVFFTVRGLSICSKPSDPWTQRAMATVDNRRRRAPTTSTASPNAFVVTALRTALTMDTTSPHPPQKNVPLHCFGAENCLEPIQVFCLSDKS